MIAPDFTFENHDSLFLVRPTHSTASRHLSDNSDGHWWGDALVVEPRYAESLAATLLDEGWLVE